MEATSVDISLTKVLANAIPGLAIHSIQPAPSPGIHRTYHATLQNHQTVLCSLPPPPNRRLLRSEFASISSEAALLQWLGRLCPPTTSTSSPSDTGAVDSDQDQQQDKNKTYAQFTSKYIPGLLEHGLAAMLPQPVPYNITIPPPGVMLSTLSPSLTPAQRKSVDFQIGQMIGSLSLLQSPTCRFGYAQSILPPVPQPSAWPHHRNSLQQSTDTYTTWSDAFSDMFDDAIQDAQLNQITAAYDSIRRLFRRFTYVLDAVVEPRLVIISAGLDTNLLVSPQSDTCSPNDDPNVSSDAESSSSRTASSQATSASSTCCDEATIKVTGIPEWTNAIFGDPFISLVFSSSPSEHLLRGFNTRIPDTVHGMSKAILRGGRSLRIRLNLYRIYHALNAISVEYIRRDKKSDCRELKARKALVEAVRDLEQEETLKRRRSKAELAQSKRPRISSPS